MDNKRLKIGHEYMQEALTDAETARNRFYRAQTNKDIAEAGKAADEAAARVSRMAKGYLNTGAGRGQVNPEAVVPRKANSRAQYEHEKAVGDPSARDLSYEEWKKL